MDPGVYRFKYQVQCQRHNENKQGDEVYGRSELDCTYTRGGERIPDVEEGGDSVGRVRHVRLQATVIIRGLAPSGLITGIRRTVRGHPAQSLTTTFSISYQPMQPVWV